MSTRILRSAPGRFRKRFFLLPGKGTKNAWLPYAIVPCTLILAIILGKFSSGLALGALMAAGAGVVLLWEPRHGLMVLPVIALLLANLEKIIALLFG